MDFRLTRPVVVTLAIIGALLATAASLLQTRRIVRERGARFLNYAGDGLMSMLLFVLAGLLELSI